MTITVDKALEIVLAHTPLLPGEEVQLDASLGRVLAEDVACDVEMPPFDRAAMDGYAVRAADVAHVPATLAVAGQVRAGQWPDRPVEPKTAVQIMTGAPVPRGASAVVPVEHTRLLDERHVEVTVAAEPGAHIARAGCEVSAGEVVASRGVTVDPATIALLASVGKAKLRVGRRPRVSILVTGDELVEVWEHPGRARIRNSNGHALEAQAHWAGAEVTNFGIVPDDPERIAQVVRAALLADVLLLSGGVSKGEFDFVEPVLARFDVGLLFTAVAVKPGAPVVFGRRGDTLVFGLPGNPVSAQVTFDLFARPALLRMQGAAQVTRPRAQAELLEPVRNKSGRLAHLPARVGWREGKLVAQPLRSAGSADVLAHARANALLVLAPERTRAEAGEHVPALLLGNFLERDGA